MPWRATLGGIPLVGGNWLTADSLALIAVEEDGFHRDQVDDAAVVVFEANRNLKLNGFEAEFLLYLLHHAARDPRRRGRAC